MNSHTDLKENTHQVEQKARNTATGKWVSRFARLGYAAKGIIYLIIGGLAALLALGQGGSATDQRGALQTIHDQPVGAVLLTIIAIGLLGFSIWSFVQALFDTEGKGRDAKGILARIGYAVVGMSYGALAFGAYQLVVGTGNGGKSSTSSTQDWTALLLNQSFGVAAVVLIGLIVIAVALYLFYKAYSAKFRSRLNLTTVNAQGQKWAVLAGRCGYAALGIVFSVIGIFLIIAALQHDPHQAKGLDSTLQTLLNQPFGPILLGIVALGLISYGIFSFVEARYRRVGRG